MLFFRFFIPRLTLQPYLTQLEQKLKDEGTRNWAPTQYNKLLNLKNLAAKADASFSQLNSLFFDNNAELRMDCNRLESNITQLISSITQKKDISTFRNNLTNTCTNLKNKLETSKFSTGISVLNILNNSFWVFASIATFYCACTLLTGPIGIIFLGVGLAILASAILLLAAYSLYVDGRYLANKQVEEIDAFIEALFSYNAEQMNPLSSREGILNFEEHSFVPVYAQM